MSCTTTTAMHLNISTDICASATATRSGSTVTVSGTFSVTQGNTWNINAIYAYVENKTTWTKVKPYGNSGGTWTANFSFSFEDSSGGTKSYNAIFQVWNNAETGTVGDAASVGFSVSVPSGATAPTGLNVTGIAVGGQSIKGTVSVTGWGGAGDANSRYRELQIWQNNMSGDYRKQKTYGDTLSSEITCNNSSSGSLALNYNTKYYIGAFATNGTYNTGSQAFGTAITNVPIPGASKGTITSNSAVINWSLVDQGGERDIKIDYKINSGSWTNVTTATGSGAKSGSFTLNNLTPNTSYSVDVRSSAVGGSVAGGITVSFTTPSTTKMYCSVNDTAKKVKRIYCSVSGQRKKVKKIYCSVGGVAKLAYEDVA